MQASEVDVMVVKAVVIDSRGCEARGSEQQACRSQGRAAGRLGNWWAERWRRRVKAQVTRQGGYRGRERMVASKR